MTRSGSHRAEQSHTVNARLAAAVLLAATGALSTTPAWAQGTAEQREACTPDAVRLCPDTIPDVERTTACMQTHRAELSRRCRVVFDADRLAPPGRALEQAGRAAAEPDPADDRLYEPRHVRPGSDEDFASPHRVERTEPLPYDDGLGPRRYLYLTPRGLEVETPEDAN